LVTYSEQLDNAVWNKSQSGTGVAPVVTANNAISPDGTQNADTVVFNSGAGTTASDISAIYQVFGGTTATYTASFYAKTPSGTAQIQVRIDGSAYEKFTITNEWQRFTLTRALTGTSNALDFVIRRGLNEPMNASATIQLWGAQVELGAYATSYIPTLGAAVTRGVDAMSKSSYACGITTEATLFADFEYQNTGSGYSTQFLIYNVSAGDYMYLTVVNNSIRAICVSAGVLQSNIILGSTTAGTRYKAAARFKQNDFALYVNGTLVGTDTSGTMPTFSTSGVTSYIGNDAGSAEPAGYVNQYIAFPTALSNSDLAALTA
jgi:hypothetical protein